MKWDFFFKTKFILTKSILAFPFSHYSPKKTVLLLLRVWQTMEGENERLRVERNRIFSLIGFIGKMCSQTMLMKSTPQI